MTQTISSVNSLAASIEAYAMAGYTIFPLKGKLPPKGYRWTEAKFNAFPQEEDFPFGNFGVKLSAEDLVIDVDPRNFPEGDKDLFKRFTQNFPIDATFCITTGSGGLHIYLKKPATMAIKGRLRDWPGIDFKSKGGYVVGAFSTHPDTNKLYLPRKNCVFTPAAASSVLLEALEQKEIALTVGIKNYVSDQQSKTRFIEYLEKAPIAIAGEAGDHTTFCVCAIGHDFGLHPDDTFNLMVDYYNPKCQPPWDISELKTKVYNAYKYTANELGNAAPQAVNFPDVIEEKKEEDERLSESQIKLFHRNQDGSIKKDQHNTVLFFTPGFEFDGLLRFNQFSNEIEFAKKAPWHHAFENNKTWTDGEALRAKFYLSHFYKFEPSTINMHEAAYVAATYRQYHPVKNYLEGLIWDGHKRVSSWLSTILGVVDDDYSRAVGLKFLVAAIKRIYEPGCKFDYIMVLEGRQGTFKSTTFEILASKDWYADPSLDLTNKDSVSMLFGKWIIELPEMETHFKSETQAMKAFLTRNTDRCRLPYHRVPMDFPRQSVFGGTINPENDEDLGWLKDTTGNRRYWPVKVGVIFPPKLEELRKVRDQIWAEAYLLYKQGINVFMDDDNLVSLARKEQEKRLSRDVWTDTIAAYLHSDMGKDKYIVTATELYRDALGGNMLHCGRREQIRIASIMHRLGWEKGVYYIADEGDSKRGYRRPVLEMKKV